MGGTTGAWGGVEGLKSGVAGGWGVDLYQLLQLLIIELLQGDLRRQIRHLILFLQGFHTRNRLILFGQLKLLLKPLRPPEKLGLHNPLRDLELLIQTKVTNLNETLVALVDLEQVRVLGVEFHAFAAHEGFLLLLNALGLLVLG